MGNTLTKTVLATALALSAVLSLPASAQSQSVFAERASPVFAGPGYDYPQVDMVARGEPLYLHGCLREVAWCDVGYEFGRGWIDADDLVVGRYGQSYPLYQSSSWFTYPILSFVLGDYWGAHYRNSPWYHDRYRYSNWNWRQHSHAWGDHGHHDRNDWDNHHDRDDHHDNHHHDNNNGPGFIDGSQGRNDHDQDHHNDRPNNNQWSNFHGRPPQNRNDNNTHAPKPHVDGNAVSPPHNRPAAPTSPPKPMGPSNNIRPSAPKQPPRPPQVMHQPPAPVKAAPPMPHPQPPREAGQQDKPQKVNQQQR